MNPKTKIQEEIAKRQKEEKIYPNGTANGKKTYPFVRFIWLDGTEQSFAYSYLAKVTFSTQDNINVVEASFYKENVIFKGYQLHGIYLGLINHTTSEVEIKDDRYANLTAPEEPIVTDIEVVEG